jgi:hypothetical protein
MLLLLVIAHVPPVSYFAQHRDTFENNPNTPFTFTDKNLKVTTLQSRWFLHLPPQWHPHRLLAN